MNLKRNLVGFGIGSITMTKDDVDDRIAELNKQAVKVKGVKT